MSKRADKKSHRPAAVCASISSVITSTHAARIRKAVRGVNARDTNRRSGGVRRRRTDQQLGDPVPDWARR